MNATNWKRWQSSYQRPVLEEYPRLDVRALHEAGLLTETRVIGWSDGSTSRLVPSNDGIDLVHWPIHTEFLTKAHTELVWTPCHFGGERVWFRCPDCSKRVAILHAFPRYSCRNCHRLAYASSNRAADYPSAAGARAPDRAI